MSAEGKSSPNHAVLPTNVPGTASTVDMDTNKHILKCLWSKIFIIFFERAFKMMKNGVYFIVIALLVAELFKILIYAN